MCNYNENEKNISIVGLYHGPLPGPQASLSSSYSWAQVAYSGRLMNFYLISRMGNQFWYPGGYAGLDCMHKNTHGVRGWPYYSMVSGMIREAFSTVATLSERGHIAAKNLAYCPYNYHDGLWFLSGKLKPTPVLVDLESHERHEHAMSVYRSYMQQQERAAELSRQRRRRAMKARKNKHVIKTFADTDIHIVETAGKRDIVGKVLIEWKARVPLAKGREPEDITKDECVEALKQWSEQRSARIEKRKAEQSASDV